MPRLVALLALGLALALPAAAQAQAVRGSPLQRTPYAGPPQDGNDCKGQPRADQFDGSPYQFVDNGQPSCSWAQQGVAGAQFQTDPRTGFVGQDGTVTSITVKVGSNPAALRFFVGRQLTPAQNGHPAGNPQCCFFVYDVGPFQPAANNTTTFAVNMPVESNTQPTIITNDFIGFSAGSNAGTLPLARVEGQDNNFSYGQSGSLNAMGFWPALGQFPNDQGGGRPPGGYGGIEVLLRYTVSPRGGGAPVSPVGQIGGNVLRPFGSQLDVVIDCLQPNCTGRLDLLTRSKVLPARKTKKIRSLGKKSFSVKQGRRKIRVKLNKLGRKLSRRKRTKVTLVATFNGAPPVRKQMTMAKARGKKPRSRKRK